MIHQFWKDAEKFVELDEKQAQSEALWLRQLLTLAAGALAILAGLGPDAPSESFAQYFLAATWACLAIGISSGGAATYIATDRAKAAADAYGEELHKSINQRDYKPQLLWASPTPILRICKPLMIFSLLAAVLSLAAYAIITTLNL